MMGMERNSTPAPVVVQQASRTPEFGLHVCRFLVKEARPVLPTVILAGSQEPNEPFALALNELLLPYPPRSKCYEFVRDSTIDGADGLWVQLPKSPLAVPLLVAREMKIEAELKVGILATPKFLDVPFSTSTLESVAWKVLTSADIESVVYICACLSLEAEVCGLETEWLERMVSLMQPQPSFGNRLLAEIRSGRPLFDHRVVRWILREMSAASEDEINSWRDFEFSSGTGEEILSRAWFRCIRSKRDASLDELLTAIWMLHDVYGGTQESSNANTLLAQYTFGMRSSGTWLSAISRWLRIWDIPDDHPSVIGRARPSEMKKRFESKMGISPSSLLVGILFICIRWQMALERQASPPIEWAQIMNLAIGESALPFSSEFESVIRREFVSGVDVIRNDAIAERPDSNANLGQLPPGDSLACRNNPIIEFSDGQVVPHSIELMADRAIDLYRLKGHGRGSGREANREMGYLFEAYVHDQLTQLRDRYMVIDATELEAIGRVYGGKVCDHVIVDPSNGSYIFVETSMQTNPRGIAAGDISAIRKKLSQYQSEADQAFEMMKIAGKVADAIGGPEPRYATALVVVDRPILHSSSIVNDQIPQINGRPLRTVCGIDELEFLVDMTNAGWGCHSLVFGWQRGNEDIPLGAYLFEHSAILGPAEPCVSLDTESVFEHLPLKESHAA